MKLVSNYTFGKILSGIIAASAFILTTHTAHAQMGTGWTSMTIAGFLDYEYHDKHYSHDLTSFTNSPPTMYYINTSSSETFGLISNASNRAEHDTDSHYQTGSRQFQGTFQMFPGISSQIVLQIFDGTVSGPIIALAAYGKNNGTLEKQGGDVILATNCFASGPMQINVIHDLNANTMTVYVNGVQKWAGGGGLGDSFNLKYGLYGTFNAVTHTVWANAKMWQGGMANIDTTAKYQLKNEASGLVLNQQGSLTNGSAITQWKSGSSDNLKWEFISTSGGYYQINSVKSGLDVNVSGASTANGAGIIQWTFGSKGNDQWLPQQNSDGSYTFVNLHSGKVLDDPGSSTSTSIQMDQWSPNSGSNQKWELIKQ